MPFASGSDRSTSAQSTTLLSSVAAASDPNETTSRPFEPNASTSISSTSHAYVRSSSMSITRMLEAPLNSGSVGGWSVVSSSIGSRGQEQYPGEHFAQPPCHSCDAAGAYETISAAGRAQRTKERDGHATRRKRGSPSDGPRWRADSALDPVRA